MGDEHLVFFADLKGTKSDLGSLKEGGLERLSTRIESFHDAAASSFIAFASRSRTLFVSTVSDSVFAWWTDVTEGLRYAFGFMQTFSTQLHSKGVVDFRGFLDLGLSVPVTSSLAQAVATNERYMQTLPLGVATWSVAMAEGGHFPNGLYVSESIATQCAPDYGSDRYIADRFTYVRLI